jgi:hypothetical protein
VVQPYYDGAYMEDDEFFYTSNRLATERADCRYWMSWFGEVNEIGGCHLISFFVDGGLVSFPTLSVLLSICSRPLSRRLMSISGINRLSARIPATPLE